MEKAYCLDCYEDESEDFLSDLRMKLIKDISIICQQHQVLVYDCPDYATLRRGCDKIPSQNWLLNIYQRVKEKIEAMVKEKDVDYDVDYNVIRERERERERDQSHSTIPITLANYHLRG